MSKRSIRARLDELEAQTDNETPLAVSIGGDPEDPERGEPDLSLVIDLQEGEVVEKVDRGCMLNSESKSSMANAATRSSQKRE